MKRIAIYNLDTGIIERIVTCPASMVRIQAQDGEGFLEAPDYITDTTHKVVDGDFVALS